MWRLTLLEGVGVLAIAIFWGKILYEVWMIFYTCYLGHALGYAIEPRKLGKWAGATDGIGRAYAEELANHGMNVVLISRSRSKLQAVAEEIERRFHVKTLVIDVDFTKETAIYERIAGKIGQLEIGVLVNNVGMSYKYPEYLAEIPDANEFSQKLINCNVVSVTRMCIMIIGQMVERRKGFILNVASCSAVVPSPLMSLYSSTKAYVFKFSQDLELEYKPFGVRVQCILPSFVATKMSGIKRPSMSVPSPTTFARNTMKSWGLEVASAGYWFHKLQWIYYLRLSEISPSSMANVTYNIMMGLRKKAFERVQQQQQKNVTTKPQPLPLQGNDLTRTERDLENIWPTLSQIPRYGITLHTPTTF